MNPPALQRIFHPADFTQGDEGASAHALRLALGAKARLTLLHVGSRESDPTWESVPGVRETLTRWGVLPAGASRAEVAKVGLQVEKLNRVEKEPLDPILDYLEEFEPDLVVLSTHQRSGLTRWIHDARAETIAHESRAMTLFVPRRVTGFVSPETGTIRLRTILIPVDHQPSPRIALAAAASIAESLGVEELRFILLHVGAEEDAPEVPVPDRAGWTFEHQAWAGAVVDHILGSAEVNDADLIVMSTRGRHGFLDALRGSTTERVVRGAKCPVLAVVAPEG